MQTLPRIPTAVLISDIHFSIPTLEVASTALLRAQFKAAMLDIPLVIAGDLHDTKAAMRAEVVNRLIQLFSVKDAPKTIVLVGNHDKVHEKENAHALNFLKPYCVVVDEPQIGKLGSLDVVMIPYQTDPKAFTTLINDFHDEGLVRPDLFIVHQGCKGSESGEYIQDHSAVSVGDLRGLRIISGHYHTRQDFDLGSGGMWSYIGNPYSLNFGECRDPEKGYQILYNDGSLEFVPANLRRHLILHLGWESDGLFCIPVNVIREGDIVWVKIEGTKEQLSQVTKEWVKNNAKISGNFRLDLIPLDEESIEETPSNLSQEQMLDNRIDSLSNTSTDKKERLKSMWKQLAKGEG